MCRDRLPYLILPVAALIAVLPLIVRGPSCGHDFDFHLLNWLEAAAQFRHGNLHPQWAVSPAWNAGEPRFVFYPPLSWTVGAILGLVLPWTWTPIVYTWLALTASGFAMHRLARAHATATASLLGATLYLANPYMLFTAYERTAYGELLAAAFLPLLVHAILKPRLSAAAIAVPLALLWLTNAPAAVMGTYTLAFLAVLRLWRMPFRATTLRPAATIAAGTLLGFALAAFYIVPAATERPLVQIAMVVLPGMRIVDNTLFHHTGVTGDALAHDAVLHTVSLVAVFLLSLTAICLVVSNRRDRSPASAQPFPTLPDGVRSSLPLPLTLLAGFVALLLTPVTLPVWRHAPELAFLQFPWRLLAVLAVVAGLSAALALDSVLRHPAGAAPYKAAAAAIALASLLVALAYPSFRQSCDLEDTVPARLAAFEGNQGSEPTDEYTPAPADNESLSQHNPPFWLSTNPDAPPPPNGLPGPGPRDLAVTSPVGQSLILNLRLYPAWRVTLNGRTVAGSMLTQTPRADGLLTLPIPAGLDRIHLDYRATPLEHASEALSVVALLLLFWPVARRSTT